MSDPLSPGLAALDAAKPIGGAPLGPHELQAVVEEAFSPDAAPQPHEADAGDPETLAACTEYELNDTGNGWRLLAHFGEDLLHVREVGWHRWTGQVWRREGGDEAVTAYAQRTAKRVHGEADLLELLPYEKRLVDAAAPLRGRDYGTLSAEEKAKVDEADRAKKGLGRRRADRRKFAVTSGNSSRISAMIAQALPHKTVGPRDLDADHMLFNCENVTLSLSRIEDPDDIGDERANYCLHAEEIPHQRDHHITKMAPVTYDPRATCPRFLAFMERFQPDDHIRRFLQIYHGLALTGQTGQQCFIYNHGTGANGKSTFMEAMAALFGPYSDLLNSESLTGQGQRRGDQATPDFADLPGVRYLRVSELPRGEPLKEALVKALTGGEEIKARHLNKGFFKFTPVFKAAMSGNDLPTIGGVDNGIWRRVKLVPWAVTITDEERRPMNEVLAEFEAERSGILNWLLEGLDLFMREGLRTPEAVTAATSSYRDEMDPIGAFAAACLEECPGHFETARSVYEAFVAWCEANSIRPWKETAFGRAMPHKGFVRENTRVRRYLNVRLHDVPPREPRSPGFGGDGSH